MIVTLSIDQVVAAVVVAITPIVESLGEGRPPRKLLDSSELAQALGVSGPTIKKLVAQGLPHTMVGSCRRFDLDEVIGWLRERGDR